MSLWLYEAAPWYDTATNTLYVPASWTAGQVVDFLTEYAHDLNNPIGKRFLAELQTNGIFSGRIGFEEYNSLLKQGLAATAEQAEGLIKQAISLGPGGDLALAAWDAQNVGIISAALTFAKSKSQDLTLGASLGVMLGVVAKRLNAPNTFARSVHFTPSTGRTYKVFQRGDINWQQVRTAGPRDFVGKTNAEAARAGLRPQLPDESFATLHHSQQSAIGPWYEVSTSYHNIRNAKRGPLHPWGGQQHPYFPLGRGQGSLREQFQEIESPEYWIWREANR